MEFLLTTSIYNQADKWGEYKRKSQLGDYWLIPYHILQTNIRRITCKAVRGITDEISRVKRLTDCVYLDRNIRQCPVGPLFQLDVNRRVKIAWIIRLCSRQVDGFYEVRRHC